MSLMSLVLCAFFTLFMQVSRGVFLNMEDITFVEDVVASVTTMVATSGADAQREQQSSNRKGCIARTKIVFADSDDEAVGEDGAKTSSSNGPTVVVVDREYNFELDEEELVDEILTVDQQTVDSFFEDVAPTSAERSMKMSAPTRQADDAEDGGDASARPRIARAATDATTAAATRKRFRDDGEDAEDDDDAAVVVEAEGVIGAKEIILRRFHSAASEVVPAADGDDVPADTDADEVHNDTHTGVTTTVARDLDGYLLTMDESDLQDYFDDEGEEDEEEDEEDDGLDDLVIVSAVEQLVNCCTSDDQTDEERAAYGPFLEKAKAALQELSDKTLTVDEFSEKMCNDVFRLQGTLRRLSRPPKDTPIIINGVLMDM
jgi:hypothetical protein